MIEERLRGLAEKTMVEGLGPTEIVDTVAPTIRDDFVPLKAKIAPESDPNGIAPHDAGCKLDSGKIRAGLLEDFSLALLEVARVLDHGSRKYSPHGWEKVENGEGRYTDAAWRHLLANRHEDYDTDSGLLHSAQVAWNFLAVLELKLRRRRTQMAQVEFSAGETSEEASGELKTN